MKKPSKNLNKKYQTKKYIAMIEYISSDIEKYPKLREDVYELAHLALNNCKYHQDWKEKWDEVYERIKIHL